MKTDSSRVFYAVRLTPTHNDRQRFQLYEIVTRHGVAELDLALWPEVVDGDAGKPNPRTKAPLAPYQVRTERPSDWPAWHFSIPGLGYPHLQGLATALARHLGCDVDVRELHGMRPSNFFGSARS